MRCTTFTRILTNIPTRPTHWWHPAPLSDLSWRLCSQLRAPRRGSANLNRDRQEWVSRTGIAPQATLFHPDLHSYGAGNTKPRHALWTSTSVTVRTSSWLQYLPISGEVGHWEPPYPRWRLEVVPAARVYEIHGPQAWNNLCLALPLLRRAWRMPTCRPDALIEPDWQAVSQGVGRRSSVGWGIADI